MTSKELINFSNMFIECIKKDYQDYQQGLNKSVDYYLTVIKNTEILEKLKTYLEKWQEQLKIDGINSKSMVLNDIQYLFKEWLESE